MKTNYTTDVSYKIWNDAEGVAITIKNDSDAGELCQIETTSDKDKKYYGDCRLVLEPELALRVAEALSKHANYLIERRKNEKR